MATSYGATSLHTFGDVRVITSEFQHDDVLLQWSVVYYDTILHTVITQ